ncbi:MAG TPA: SDR family oxidoreductase [Bacillota bacterium]|nr:SDR family oxidoreductase [Bacillota bacterium]HPL52698.1 SDR family oxidoreductase [Bacillota bacterium]
MDNYEPKLPEKSKFLVTGGAGFIGSNLIERILGAGHEAVALDNFSTGREDNIREFIGNKNFLLMEGDIQNIEDCRKACKNVDYVLHQAALGSVPRSIEKPGDTNDSNITGTLNMLIAARDSNVKRFVYASSSSVYGDSQQLPKREDKTGRPLSPYAISKVTGELYGRNFFDLFGLPTIGLRYFNVFGKKQSCYSAYAAVIPKFIGKLLKGERPVINGDGEQSRDFTYVENVVDANLAACAAEREAFGEVFNIGNGERISINGLYSKIAELLHIDLDPIYGPERCGDVKHSNADISKAKSILKYWPAYNFNEGLKLCISWYINNL